MLGWTVGAQFPPDRYRDAAALIAEFGAGAGDVALSRAVAAMRAGADSLPALEVTEVVLRLLEAVSESDGEACGRRH